MHPPRGALARVASLLVLLGCGSRTGLLSGSGLDGGDALAFDAPFDVEFSGDGPTDAGDEVEGGTVCDGGVGLVTLADNQVEPFGVALDDTHVYWTDFERGDVMKVPLCGGEIVTLASLGTDHNPWFLAVDAERVYWADWGGDAVLSVGKAGGEIVTLATKQSGPLAVALDDTSVYWTNNGSGALLKAPKTGGAPTSLLKGSHAYRLVVRDGTVYFTDRGGVLAMPSSGGTPTTLASGQDEPHGIAVDDTSVYWANFAEGTGHGSVMKVPRVGGPAVTLVSGLKTRPDAVAVDATRLYFTETLGGNVLAMPLDGGMPETLASGAGAYECLVVDATSLYWPSTPTTPAAILKLTPK